MALSMNPEGFALDTIYELTEQVKPPKMPSDLMDKLDFHTVGINSVFEALSDEPIPHLQYRELSRYATHLALANMLADPVIQELQVAYRLYKDNKKQHPEYIRSYYDDNLDGVSKGYRPFKARKNLHVWFWDMEEKEQFHSLAGDAKIPRAILFAYVAGVLAELDGLQNIAEDLKREYDMGMRFLKTLLANVSDAASECSNLT